MKTQTSKKGFVTISVDDGSPLDLKTAALLARYDLKATFYIPARNPDGRILSPSEIREIYRNFEVGGHTFNHVSLKNLSSASVQEEIMKGKKWLEDIVKNSLVSFCYPLGKFNSSIVAAVKKAGFLGARTCLLNLTEWPLDSFLMGVSSQAYSHSPTIQIRHALLEKNFLGAKNYLRVFKRASDWEKHFIKSLDYVEENGGIAHLYLHSWEIDEQGHWEKLERVFQNIRSRPKLERVTNGDLFKMIQSKRETLELRE